MKTMQLKEEIVRVNDNKAEQLALMGWKFVPKSLWKEKVRDINKKEEPVSKKKKGKKKK